MLSQILFKYGATMMYTDEIIDKKIALCHRVVNEGLGLIEYVQGDKGSDETVFQTPLPDSIWGQPYIYSNIVRFEMRGIGIHFKYLGKLLREFVNDSIEMNVESHATSSKSLEVTLSTHYVPFRERVVFQIGTGDAIQALRGAEVVASDVCAIDVNMGCPVHFSTQGGMGSALLSQPDKIVDILTTLRRNLNIPVTCKIRLLRDSHRTLDLLRQIESCGVAAVAIHARHIPDRPRWRAMPEHLPELVSSISIPVIYNGDVFVHDDIARLSSDTGASSIMIGRGALWNASIFQPEPKSVLEVARHYLSLCRRLQTRFAQFKHVLTAMFAEQLSRHPLYTAMSRCRDYAAMDEILESMPKLLDLSVLENSNDFAGTCHDTITVNSDDSSVLPSEKLSADAGTDEPYLECSNDRDDSMAPIFNKPIQPFVHTAAKPSRDSEYVRQRQLASVCLASRCIAPVPLLERPWVLDPRIPVVPEFTANGKPVSMSTGHHYYKN